MKSTAIAARRRKRRLARHVSSAGQVSHQQATLAAPGEIAEGETPKLAEELQAAAPPPRLMAAKSGDHAAIHQFLLSLFHGPSAGEFHAQLEEPLYEPTDRLLVKQGDQVVSHLRLSKRSIRMGGISVPAAGFMDLGTAPEYRGRGFATALLNAGQQQAIAEGAVLGLTRTVAPELFAGQGWSVCGRHSFSVAGPRQILAYLCNHFPDEAVSMEESPRRVVRLGATDPPILVRPLRRIELPAVIRLYDESTVEAQGAPVRSDAYWEWLMARSAFDRAYVALVGGEPSEISQLLAAVVGYAFVKEGRLVELVTAPGRERAARGILSRVCADCLERNLASVRVDAPPDHPLHELVAGAGGVTHRSLSHHGQVHMARVFDPLALLRLLGDTLVQRVKQADLPLPLSLGLDVYYHNADLQQSSDEDVRSYRLLVGQRQIKLTPGHVGRSYLSLTRRDMTPLLLGHSSAEEAIAAGRIRASTRLAQEAAAILFPRLPWFRPALDELLA